MEHRIISVDDTETLLAAVGILDDFLYDVLPIIWAEPYATDAMKLQDAADDSRMIASRLEILIETYGSGPRVGLGS